MQADGGWHLPHIHAIISVMQDEDMQDEEATTHNHDSDQDNRHRNDHDRTRSLWTRAAIAALIAAGIAGYAAAVMTGGGNDRGDVTTTANPAVDRLIPQRGDETLRQSRVGVRLDSRYRLTSLTIYFNNRFSDGINVTSEVSHSSGLNLWQFTPGEGRLIQALSPDANCATAAYEPIARPGDIGTISWCFQAS